MQDTINEIVRATRFPMSIIIVGVGDEDFSLMDELDADEAPLYSTVENVYMERDIVQFVPFADFKDRSYLELAMCTLDEVPREVVNYFQKKGIQPPASMENQDKLAKTGQLTVKQVKAADTFELPVFLQQERERLASAAVSQGYQRDDVERALKDGVPSAELASLIDILNNTEYRVFGNCFQTEWKKKQEELKKRGSAALGGQPPKMLKSIRQSMSTLSLDETLPTGATSVTDTARAGLGLTAGSDSRSRTTRPGSFERSVGSRNDNYDPADGPEDEEVVDPRGGSSTSKKHKDPASKKKKKKKKDAAEDDLDNICKVCFENVIDTVILDCGHQVVCQSCSTDIGSLCPLCRNPIARIIKTYQVK
ncbi:unnamed protein product [Amoebophrya sp. A25]|nr:unnamed protein product [Amoebophrya sp. A25]|eukprot:GSA25T00014909001.1